MGNDWLAEQFEAHRPHLRAVAYRMLGPAEADDAVQEAWARLSRSDAGAIDNLGAWLTTVVARVSLDMLRARNRHDTVVERYTELAPHEVAHGPEDDAVLADSVGAALVVVLERLTPGERLAFVLHDMFAVPFDEIAEILGRSPAATKMLASRARHKVQGSGPAAEDRSHRQRAIVDAFLAASRNGEFDALIALLDPEVVLRADAEAVRMGSPEELRGARAVAGMFSGRANTAQAALIDGAAGLVWSVGGRPRVAWEFTLDDGRIVRIDMLAAREKLEGLALEIFAG